MNKHTKLLKLNADDLYQQCCEDDLQQQDIHDHHDFLLNKHTELLQAAASQYIYCSSHCNTVFQHVCLISVHVQINEELEDAIYLQSASEHSI